VVSASPPFGATDWTEGLLELTFDEFVQVRDARNQVLVSPPLPESPRVLVKGRSIVVDLGEGLVPDRTYVVQFGNAIQDLRESNVATGLQHVFATGSQLDSGRVATRVLDAWTGEPMVGARLMLYSDSLPEGITNPALHDSLRPLPGYVGFVGDSGVADIGFLPDGRFVMVALDDLNGNYRVDAGESVAWWAASVSTLDSSGVISSLRMDVPSPQPATYLSGMRVDSSGFWRAKLEGWTDLKEGPDGCSERELAVAMEGPGGITEVHLEGDSLWAELMGFQPQATVGSWRLTHPAGVDSLRFRDVEPFSAPAVAERPDSKVNAMASWSVRWVPAPDVLDTSQCVGLVVMDEDTTPLEKSLLALDRGRLRCGPLPPGSRCDLELLPGAVGRDGRTNADTLRFRWATRTFNDVGSVVLQGDSIADREGMRSLFVLTTGSGSPLYDRLPDGDGRFTDLEPGRYGLVRIEDLDGNGRWTGVDPVTMREAEPVTVVSKDIEVRAGWEVELVLPFLPRP